MAFIACGRIIISVRILPNGNPFGSSHIDPDESQLATVIDNDETERRRSWSAFEQTRLARTTAQLIVVLFELVVRTVVLDFVELEAFIVNEPVVTGLRAEYDMTFGVGDVKVVLDDGIMA